MKAIKVIDLRPLSMTFLEYRLSSPHPTIGKSGILSLTHGHFSVMSGLSFKQVVCVAGDPLWVPLVLPALWEVFGDKLCSLVEKSPGTGIVGISRTISLHHLGTPVL